MNTNIDPNSTIQIPEYQKLKEVTPEEAKRRLLDMMVEFDAYCQEHNLTYYLAYGTLLGAVRHKGFIPWDDDMDICMPRKDYDRLIELSYTWKMPYDFYCFEKDKNYLFYFGKISDRKTLLKNIYMRETNRMGLFIDIFPMDFFLCEKSRTERLSRIIYRETKLLEFSGMQNFWPAKSPAKSFMKYMLYRYAKFMGNMHWQNKISKAKELQTVKMSDQRKPYCVHAYRVLPEEVFGIGKKMEFEGYYLNCPQNAEAYLTAEYGEYLRLPPEENRKSNHDYFAYWR